MQLLQGLLTQFTKAVAVAAPVAAAAVAADEAVAVAAGAAVAANGPAAEAILGAPGQWQRHPASLS